jgi:hypothetical protein
MVESVNENGGYGRVQIYKWWIYQGQDMGVLDVV